MVFELVSKVGNFDAVAGVVNGRTLARRERIDDINTP